MPRNPFARTTIRKAMRYPAAVVAIIFCSLLLSYSSYALIESAENLEWQILTNRNFSSEIRLHPHILLMVTIPWSGEARSLMNQLGKLIADQPEKHGHLRLMVVYKNSQKMLADVLGATEDISMYYYHQSTPYKYHGGLAVKNILSSVYYFISLKPEEVPLKHLHTQDEIDLFVKSTDKAVFLVELCGWSSKLLRKKSFININSEHLNCSEHDDMSRTSLFEEVDERLSIDMKNRKALENKGLYCGVENVLLDSPRSEEFCWANNSILEEMEYEAADIYLSCKPQEFEQFKSSFSKFKHLATEFFLPPERTRFGLLTERSLLPYVGVNTMRAWLFMLQFNGCHSCSMVIETADDLRNILQKPYSPVMQLDVNGQSLDFAFPANGPSAVLFIDRFSDLPLVREKSMSALDAFKKLAVHYYPSYITNKGTHHIYSQSSTTPVLSESQTTEFSDSPRSFVKDHLFPKLVKIKDTMAIVTDEGQNILSDQTASYTQGNAVYDALIDFITKRNIARKKQTKISLLAKESGFQLLSDDFEVQVADSSPFNKEHNLLSDINKHKVLSTGDQNFKVHQQLSEGSLNQNTEFLAAMKEPEVVDTKEGTLEDSEYDISKYLETVTEENSNTKEDEKIYKQNEMGSLVTRDEMPLLKREVSSVGACMEKVIVNVGCSSSSIEGTEMVSHLIPSEDFTGEGETPVKEKVTCKGFQLLQPSIEDSVIQNEPKVMSLGVQSFKFHQQSSDDSVNQNYDLLNSIKEPVLADAQPNALGDAKDDDTLKYLETAIEKNDRFNENDKRCEQHDRSLKCHDEIFLHVEQEGLLGTCMEKGTDEAVGCSTNAEESAEAVSHGSNKDFVGVDAVVENVIEPNKEHYERQSFQCSFFYIDGGYRLLSSLTGGSNIPALILMDPVEQCHYVFNADGDIDYSSLISFLEKFQNGSLYPYQPSSSSMMSSKEAPQPPFVNLDFHEIDAIPRVTTNTFCELVFGFKSCVNAFQISKVQSLGDAWRKDVLVLFGSSWCGFCQRMELLVREVFHAFKYLKDMLECKSSVPNPLCILDNNVDIVEFSLPSIFLMDCTLNDCGSFLKSVGRKEQYPELLLYLAQNKSVIPYEGDMLVANIIKFIVSQGRNSQYLNKYAGYLWKPASSNGKQKSPPHDSSPLLISQMKPDNKAFRNKGGHSIVPGFVLSATDKLREAAPFDNSTILITAVNEAEQSVQGIIVNKPVSWNIFDNLEKDMEPVKRAPISYGGPVTQQGLPLVSLAKKPTEGFAKVVPGFYFGNPMITRMVIEGIKVGDLSAREYWFFLGYCNWKWEQLLGELAEGAWYLSAASNGRIDWPNS